jgi:hypothetical protein
MEQNVIVFPTQPPASERLRLYRDDPCIVLVLAAVRTRDRDLPWRPCATSAGA